MSRAITLPEPSHIPFRGDSLNSRGSGDSSIYPPPPRHSMHSCTKAGQRRVSQYLAMANASQAQARPVASVAAHARATLMHDRQSGGEAKSVSRTLALGE